MEPADDVAATSPTVDSLRERVPNFDRMFKAWEEFTAGKPVTQRTVDTNQPIFAVIYHRARATYTYDASGRVLDRASIRQGSPWKPGMPEVTASVFQDPETGERLTWPEVEAALKAKAKERPG